MADNVRCPCKRKIEVKSRIEENRLGKQLANVCGQETSSQQHGGKNLSGSMTIMWRNRWLNTLAPPNVDMVALSTQ